MPSMVQQLILFAWGCLLTSAFGVFSVCMNMVRTAPVRTCGRRFSFNLKESIRGLDRVFEAARLVDMGY